MCFAKTSLMVALQKGYVKNEGQRFGIGMSVCAKLQRDRANGAGD